MPAELDTSSAKFKLADQELGYSTPMRKTVATTLPDDVDDFDEGDGVSGEKTLGTLRISTSSTFGRLVQAQVGVALFSIGPNRLERDEYTGGELNLGVVVNE